MAAASGRKAAEGMARERAATLRAEVVAFRAVYQMLHYILLPEK
jgi:hypothetical protein